MLNIKNDFLHSSNRGQSILFGITFIISLTQSADVLTSYPCPRMCGCYQGDIQNEVISVVCRLDAVSPEVDLSVIKTSVPSVLYIMCSSEASISQVRSDMFTSLSSFTGLYIENCKIPFMKMSFLFGLHSLEQLEIKSAGKLKMEDSIFYHIPNLTHITITSSQVTKLPDLCRSENLKYINFTNNELPSMDSAGINCENKTILPNLSTLILDKNSISNISSRDFISVAHLKDLRIADGNLVSIEEGAFSSLREITYLDITNNSITEVSPSLFSKTLELQVLGLGRNPLSSVPKATFSFLRKLMVLTLDNAGLGNAVWFSLPNLHTLKDLQLQGNVISKLNKTILSNLIYLQNLDLGNNDLTELPTDIFHHMNELRFLHLNRNKLQEIKNGTFMGLINALNLDLSGNDIREIEKTVFYDLESVLKVDISENNLTRIPNFRMSRTVQWLNLCSNHIRKLSSGSFEGLQYLEHLNFSKNRLIDIQNGSFSHIPLLKTLDLSFNNIQYIQIDAFDGLQLLSELILHNNVLETISVEFLPLDNLLSIDLSYNKLTMKLKSGMFPKNIESIDLSDNKIDEVSQFAVKNYQTLRRLSLQNNKLTTLKMNDLVVPLQQSKKTMVYISGNPFNCDCSLIWLRNRVNDISMDSEYPLVGDIYNIECVAGYRIRTPLLLSTVEPGNMLCAYNQNCQETCTCCDDEQCGCLSVCPVGCSCYNSGSDKYHYVQCSNRGLNKLPDKFPANSTEVLLDKNNISSVHTMSFDRLIYLRVIHLDHNGILTLGNRSFNGLPQLEILYLNNNHIDQITDGVFENLRNLAELHLEFNKISFIEDGAFSYLESLSVLYLNHNRLMTLPDSVVKMLWIVDNITLSGNPWPCDCDFRINTLPILTNRSLIVFDFNNSFCHNSSVQNCNITEPKAAVFRKSVHILVVIIVTCSCCTFFITCVWLVFYSRYKINVCKNSSRNNPKKTDNNDNGTVLMHLL